MLYHMRQINIRLTDAEYASLATEAARLGMSPTRYLTEMAREENPEYGTTWADLELDRRDAAAEVTRDRRK